MIHNLKTQEPVESTVSTDSLGSPATNVETESESIQKPTSLANTSLAKLLYDRIQLSEEITEAGGEITDEQDIIWRNQELAIKDKVDAYGYVLTELEAELEKLKELKREATARVQSAVQRTQTNIERLKSRLHLLSEGSPLRGHIYSFHPYQSERKEVTDIDKVEDKFVYLTVEITESDWKSLLESAETFKPEFKILKRGTKVSQLPDNHPAVSLKRKDSVRVT